MRKALFATLLLSAAASCSVPARADELAAPPHVVISPRTALAIAPAKIRAPYDVQVVTEGGETAPTYAHRDRFYVQGSAGERYIIRITNPTANRIEAVVSVDGLDVVDGEAGDLRKRGYVVPPYGETRIEGFRTSHEDVATFRFSSVNDSYAGKKGKARNVGVIAVALFEEERHEQQIIVTEPVVPNYRQPYDYEDDLDASVSRNMKDGRARGGDRVSKADKAAPPRAEPKRSIAPSTSPAPGNGRVGGAPAPTKAFEESWDGGGGESAPVVQERQQRERPGLGTEFGEQRYSAASFTKFVRAADRPIAIAELRYNDAGGLMALGIPVTPLPDEGEIMTRETADPFPGDSRYAQPPR